MDDPPRYDERNAMAWLVLFMTHVASNNAAAVTETAELSQGGVIFGHTDPNLRRKMAKRLGMAQHPTDAEVVQKAVAEAAALAEAGKQEEEPTSEHSGDDSSSSADESSEDDEDTVTDTCAPEVSGMNFRVADVNARRFEKKIDAYEAASRKIAGWLRSALIVNGKIDTEIATAWHCVGGRRRYAGFCRWR